MDPEFAELVQSLPFSSFPRSADRVQLWLIGSWEVVADALQELYDKQIATHFSEGGLAAEEVRFTQIAPDGEFIAVLEFEYPCPIDANKPAFEHRDRVLRAYYDGRDWDDNPEFNVKRHLVMNSRELLPEYPYLIEDEWEAEIGRPDIGRGDLVFTDGAGRFAVVEVKWIDHKGKGKNRSFRRTLKRKIVKAQALRYAKLYLDLALDQLDLVKQVKAFTYTNENSRPCLLQTFDREYFLTTPQDSEI